MTTPPVSSRQPQAAFRALRPAQLSQGRFAIMAHVLGENGKPTCGMALDLVNDTTRQTAHDPPIGLRHLPGMDS